MHGARPWALDSRAVLAYALAAVGLLLLLRVLPASTLSALIAPRMLSVHLVLELFAVCIAVLVVTVSWHSFGGLHTRSVNAVIAGFSAVALLDLMHVLTYAGMPTFLRESSTPAAIFFWLSGRSVELLALACIALGLVPRVPRGAALAGGVFAGIALAVYGSFALDTFPVTFEPGLGVTPFKARWEYLLFAGDLLVAAGLHRRARARQSAPLAYLALSSLTMGLGELCFTSYQRPSDFQNIAGHLYKVVAYALLYRATFLSSLRAPYDALAASEARIRERDESLRALGANLPNTVLFQSVVERDGTRHFTQVSQAVERICGLSPEEVLRDGDRWVAQIVAEDRPVFEEALRRIAWGGQPADVQVRMRRPDGVLLRVAISAASRRLPDGRLVLDGTLTDITERIEAEAARLQLEQQLREAQKMESIGTLASGIAHDFNNVVGAILGNASLAERALETDRPGDARALLAQIAVAGRRARELVRQIMAFGRKQPMNLQVQALAPIVDEALGLLRATLPAGVEVRRQFLEPDLHAAVDATQIQQVVLNLCTNAWHAMDDPAGRIDVGLARVELDGTERMTMRVPAGTYACLWVEDNGRGMDEATRKRVFEPFFTTKAPGQGTGLGLSVVHGIVAAHRGAIQLRSEVGVGTRFDIYLPLASASVPAPRPEAAPVLSADAGEGCIVLHVDDDPVVSLMCAQLLLNAGFQVLREERVETALRVVADARQRIDMIVTDFNMPGINGIEFLRRARQARPGVPALLCSGFVSEDLRRAAAELGRVTVVQKEESADELVPAARRLLSQVA